MTADTHTVTLIIPADLPARVLNAALQDLARSNLCRLRAQHKAESTSYTLERMATQPIPPRSAPIPPTIKLNEADRQALQWLADGQGANRFTLDAIDRQACNGARKSPPAPGMLDAHRAMLVPLIRAGMVIDAPGPRGGQGWRLTDIALEYCKRNSPGKEAKA